MKANIMKNRHPLLSQNYMNPRFQPKTSFPTHEKSLFLRQNDYWIIRYHGHTAFLKSTRGMQYLAVLLQRSGTGVPCQ